MENRVSNTYTCILSVHTIYYMGGGGNVPYALVILHCVHLGIQNDTDYTSCATVTVVEGEDENSTCIGESRQCHSDTTLYVHLHITTKSHMLTKSAMNSPLVLPLYTYFTMLLQIVWRT